MMFLSCKKLPSGSLKDHQLNITRLESEQQETKENLFRLIKYVVHTTKSKMVECGMCCNWVVNDENNEYTDIHIRNGDLIVNYIDKPLEKANRELSIYSSGCISDSFYESRNPRKRFVIPKVIAENDDVTAGINEYINSEIKRHRKEKEECLLSERKRLETRLEEVECKLKSFGPLA